MKTIITGSKTVQSYQVVADAVAASGFGPETTEVFTTQESGPPIFGYRWAMERKIPVRVFRADWKAHGKPAGFIRDREMATFCDAAVVVWDGSDFYSSALLKYFRGLDPKVRVFSIVVGVEVTPTLVNQGREESGV